MAILGQIRQRSIFLILVIGMALFAFVISGVFDGSSNGGAPTDPIAVVNDEDIEVDFFRQLVEQTERSYGVSTLQAVNTVWEQSLRSLILDQQYDYLGIDAGKDQIEQIISSNDGFLNDPRFQNEAGFFDFGRFTDFIATMKAENPTAFEQWKFQEASMIALAKENIYLNLIRSSSSFTQQEGKMAYHLENDKVNMEYVQIPYDIVSDEEIQVSDAEIKKYIANNKADYMNEAYRHIQYVFFAEEASPEDEARLYDELEALLDQKVEYNEVSKLTDTIEGFKTTKNLTDFIDRYSEQAFDSVYKAKGSLPGEYAEVIFGLEENEVFGPYKDNDSYKISKLIDRKRNANIRASHILIAYEGAQRANSTVSRTKAEARRVANRLLRTARRNPDGFADLAKENSDGPSAQIGGDLGFFREGVMAPEFFEFANKNRVGRIGLVETDFGYHIIRVEDKQDLVLLAEVVKAIVPSDETSNIVFREATQLEVDSKNNKDFVATAEKNDYELIPVRNLSPMDELLPGGIGRQRAIVQWAFNEDTALGAIRKFSLPQGGYAVVQLSKIGKPGVKSVEEVRTQVTTLLEKEKRAASIQEKFASYNTLEALAEAVEGKIQTASAITQKNATLVGAGNEPYVIGAAFALKDGATSDLIVGNRGLYKIKVVNKEIAIDISNYSAYQSTLRNEEYRRINTSVYEALKSAASIEDNRALYY